MKRRSAPFLALAILAVIAAGCDSGATPADQSGTGTANPAAATTEGPVKRKKGEAVPSSRPLVPKRTKGI